MPKQAVVEGALSGVRIDKSFFLFLYFQVEPGLEYECHDFSVCVVSFMEFYLSIRERKKDSLFLRLDRIALYRSSYLFFLQKCMGTLVRRTK